MGKCTIKSYYNPKTKLIHNEVYINNVRVERENELPQALKKEIEYLSGEIKKHPNWGDKKLESTIWL